MIGAMAILAILASVLAPSVVRQIQTATAVGEDTKMDDIVQALTNGIRATGIIPNPNLNPTNTNVNGFGWAYLASNYTRLSGSNLTSVFPGLINITVSSGVTNTNETYRRLYLSTNLAATASNGGFANTMTNWGAVVFPTNAKMYLVSASRPDFTLVLATNGLGSGVQTAANNYSKDAVSSLDSWVKQFSNGVISAPENIVGVSRTNQGEFLHLRTIDIAGIFNETRAAQQKAIEQEDANLEEIARALVAAIQATGQLPNPNVKAFDAGGWAKLAQNYTTLTANTPNPPANANERGSLEFAFPRDAKGGLTARRVFLDPRLMRYLVANGRFLTPNNGWNSTTDADASGTADMNEGAMRMYIVSSSKPDLELEAPVNGPDVQTAAKSYDDDGLLTALLNWKKVYTPPGDPMPGVIPVPDVIAQWGNPYTPLVNYSTRGEFVNVKVVDLRPLFCKVTLIDTAAPEDIALFNVAVQGNGYPPSSTISVQLGGNTLSFTTTPPDTFVDGNADLKFTADSPDTLNDNNGNGTYETDGTIRLGDKPSFSQSAVYNSRHDVIANTVIPPGTAKFAGPKSPNAPTYDLYATVLPTAGDFLPSPDPAPPVGLGADHNQTQTFYVLKGRSINLFDGANALNKSVIIQSDVQYRYFNKSWNQVD
jgi:hypothetical protein